jgi:hypothetical protein
MLIVLLTEWRIKHRCITLENIKFVNYEKIKTITGIALMAIFGFTSCQSEVDDVQGENPNTNAATTANNLKRTSMMVHLMILLMELLVLPLCLPAKVNGSQVTLFSQLDYQQVISILGRFNNDQDSVVLQFPLRVKQVTIQKLRQTIKQSIMLS